MDSYPQHLAPEFDEGGGVATPFEEWWPRVQEAFLHVPEEVARDWLHRHWRHSPFGWLPSAGHIFRRVEWPSEGITEIRSRWNNFDEDPRENIEHGDYLANHHRRTYGYALADYMVEQGTFPVPPVVVDNRDGHLTDTPHEAFPLPAAYILVEGHRRFNIAAYLASVGKLQPTVPFWLMEGT